MTESLDFLCRSIDGDQSATQTRGFQNQEQNCFIRRLAVFAASSCVLMAIIGMYFLEVHARTPGPRSEQPATWPKQSTLPRSETTPTLVTFFHPHCPCSIATLAELERLIPTLQSHAVVITVLVVPAGVSADWSEGALSRRIASTPNLRTITDRNAEESELFGIQTSGHAVLYDSKGKLLFSGGLTVSRGHQGANAGCEVVRRLVTDPDFAINLPKPVLTKVFGCGTKSTGAGTLSGSRP